MALPQPRGMRLRPEPAGISTTTCPACAINGRGFSNRFSYLPAADTGTAQRCSLLLFSMIIKCDSSANAGFSLTVALRQWDRCAGRGCKSAQERFGTKLHALPRREGGELLFTRSSFNCRYSEL